MRSHMRVHPQNQNNIIEKQNIHIPKPNINTINDSTNHIFSTQQTNHDKQQCLCYICYEMHESNEMKHMSSCGHQYCFSCINKYVNELISCHMRLVCPHQTCKQPISTQSSKDSRLFINYISQADAHKIQRYVKQRESKFILCNKCQFEDSKDKTIKECTKCGNTKIQVALPQDHKLCPNCRKIIEKVKGCDHIKCVCQYQFCFSCSQKWINNHICEGKFPIRTGVSYVICFMTKSIILCVLLSILFPIFVLLVLLICSLSSVLFSFFVYFQQLQKVISSQAVSQACKFFIFVLLMITLPFWISLLLIPGFFVPLYNIFSQQKIMFRSNVIQQLCQSFQGCINLIRLI